METLFKKHRVLVSQVSMKIVRQLMDSINWEKQLVSIRGSRGVGKPTPMHELIDITENDFYSPSISSSVNPVYLEISLAFIPSFFMRLAICTRLLWVAVSAITTSFFSHSSQSTSAR